MAETQSLKSAAKSLIGSDEEIREKLKTLNEERSQKVSLQNQLEPLANRGVNEFSREDLRGRIRRLELVIGGRVAELKTLLKFFHEVGGNLCEALDGLTEYVLKAMDEHSGMGLVIVYPEKNYTGSTVSITEGSLQDYVNSLAQSFKTIDDSLTYITAVKRNKDKFTGQLVSRTVIAVGTSVGKEATDVLESPESS